jgi:anion-transporting  ArsA/GET3 family ATPase
VKAQLHVVSGKGGVGKTTVAAALALALASEGGRVLLAEVEGRQGLAQLFDVAPLPYAEVRLAPAPQGGEVVGLAIDPEAALYEYLDLFYRLGPAGKVLRKVGAVDFATTVAPGLRDVLLTGKIYEAVGQRRAGRQQYDAVVVDAPPTGRITRFLNVGSEVSGLAKVGPIRAQADAITSLVKSPRAVVHLVTLLEEMPVQETADAIDELHAADIPVGRVIVNGMRTRWLDTDQRRLIVEVGADPDRFKHQAAETSATLKHLGMARPVGSAKALLDEAVRHEARLEQEDEQLSAVHALDPQAAELPWIDNGVDLAALLEMAAHLRTSVVTT